jgi:hypothetical protein
MATKRKRTHHRRKRVGAASMNPKNPLILLASVGVGYYFSDQIFGKAMTMVPIKTTAATATTAASVSPYVSATILGGGFVGAGALLALKGRRTLPKTIAGGVLAGAGLKGVLKDQGVISGFASVPVVGSMGRKRVAGYQSVNVLGKVPSALNGYVTSRTAAMGMVPNSLKGYTTSRMPAMAGFDEED